MFITELPFFFCPLADHKVTGIAIETDNKNVKAEEVKKNNKHKNKKNKKVKMGEMKHK